MSLKRPADTDPPNPEAKYPRLDYIDETADIFKASLERHAVDLLRKSKPNLKLDGHLSGKVYMRWKALHKFNLEIKESPYPDSKVCRFDVELCGVCKSYADKLDILPGDVIKVGLEGATVEEIISSSGPNSLPIRLKFLKGVIIKHVSRSGRVLDEIFDTWKLRGKSLQETKDDWFSSPSIEAAPEPNAAGNNQPAIAGALVRHLPIFSPQEMQGGYLEAVQNPLTGATPKLDIVPKASDIAIHSCGPDTLLISGPSIGITGSSNEEVNKPSEESKRSKKKVTKRQRKRELKAKAAAAAAVAESAMMDPPQDASDAPVAGPSNVVASEPVNPSTSTNTAGPRIEPTPDTSESKVASVEPLQAQNTTTDFESFSTESGRSFTIISDIVESKVTEWNAIGIVASTTPIRRSNYGSRDFYRTIYIFDPSSYHISKGGFSIISFTGTYEKWLPSAEEGAVLVICGMKLGKGPAAVCYKDKLTWAIFNPETDRFHHGDIGDTPRHELNVDGRMHSPFLQPGQKELAYCRRISQWWNDAKKKNTELPDQSVIQTVPSAVRIHRLICDAGPHVPPKGFFDCTVEILYTHSNDNGVCTVYVTDYTINQEIVAVEAAWCPPELGPYILRMEMWNEAAVIGRMMKPGDFFHLGNSRLKVSHGGRIEGTISEKRKIAKLDENNCEHNVHLKDLLVRKKEWETKHANSSFEHQLLKDGADSHFFNCTVEVLHTTSNSPESCFLYATDYSVNHEFSPVPTADWSSKAGLTRRIVTIKLCDKQMEMANFVEPGSFYLINKLRLKKPYNGTWLQGRLGGAERLIHKLRTQDSANEHLKALIQRKAEWQCDISSHNTSDTGNRIKKKAVETKRELSVKPDRRRCRTIKDILANKKCPNKFRLVARVVDFYPPTLEEFVVPRCTQCSNDIPSNLMYCVDCDDMVESHVKYFYRFFLQLEDDDGEHLEVSVHDQECSLLEGLEPVDFRDDPDGLKGFVKRLEPVIGNLIEVHKSFDHGEDIDILPCTQKLQFIVNSWTIDDTRIYGLVRCDPL